MELRDFTPAQTLMLISPFRTNGKQLLKYSFLDLVYKGILVAKKKPLFNRRFRVPVTIAISRGKLFHTYKPAIHQDPLVAPFEQEDKSVRVRSLMRKVLHASGRSRGFKSKKVYAELKKAGYFRWSIRLRVLNFFFLTGEGRKLRKKFKAQLKDAERLLPTLAKDQKKEAQEILNQLGSNVLLLKCFEDELIDQLKATLKTEENGAEKKSTASNDDLAEDVNFEGLFFIFLGGFGDVNESFDSFAFDFDSSVGSFSHSTYVSDTTDSGYYGGDSVGSTGDYGGDSGGGDF